MEVTLSKWVASLLKRDLLCKERFRPKGSKFFPDRADPLSKGLSVQESELEVTNVVSFGKMDGNPPENCLAMSFN